jgi:hypothetical protein
MALRGAKPGRKKYGGRKKGTPNKKTLMLKEILEGLKFDPVTKMTEVYAIALERALDGYDGDVDMRNTYLSISQKCCADLLPYIYPRRKAVEISADEKMGRSLVDMVKAVSDK